MHASASTERQAQMARRRTLLVVLAGGAGGRLQLLTEDRAKPAVPVGGGYRLIDIPLSNAHHSGVDDVWVIEQFNPASIADHLANGRPWDLDRTSGGLLILHPHLGADKEGWHHGTADALWRQAELIRQFAPEHLVVVSADALYRLDYDEVVTGHANSGAGITMVTTRRPLAEARRYGVVEVGGGRITGYSYKPDEPATDLVSTEVFVFRPTALLDLLDELAEAGQLGDLGDEVLPRLVAAGGAREHRLGGYWRDVGTVPAYLQAHLELTADPAPFRLDAPHWPMLTAAARQGSARVAGGAQVVDALLSPGCRVAGRVERSVLSPDVVVAAGAEVIDSVLLPGAVVEPGARLRNVVADQDVRIGREARLGRSPGAADREDDVILVQAGARVPDGAEVPQGARVRTGSTRRGDR
jgi:glucose-1-phosphate adenylyltransferase